jgi:Fe2+ transport system protein B
MVTSAVVMAVLGLAASFLPQELVALADAPANSVITLMVQLLGALLVAFAMVNWMAKDSLIGGIYNRPVALGNLVHFSVGGIALVKVLMAGHAPGYLYIPAALYVLFAIAFATLGSPVKPVDRWGQC